MVKPGTPATPFNKSNNNTLTLTKMKKITFPLSDHWSMTSRYVRSVVSGDIEVWLYKGLQAFCLTPDQYQEWEQASQDDIKHVVRIYSECGYKWEEIKAKIADREKRNSIAHY